MVSLNFDAPQIDGHAELEQAVATLRARGLQPHKNGDGWISRCPTHDDKRQSLSLGVGKNGKLLLRCHANQGCGFERIRDDLGINAAGARGDHPGNPVTAAIPAEPKKRNTVAKPTDGIPRGSTVTEAYAYTDEHGATLYLILRLEPKSFRPRVPTGDGRWYTDLGDTRRVLYDLPDVLATAQAGGLIYVCEGEKACERVKLEGVTATTQANGAKHAWTRELVEPLRGAHVAIIADSDDAGRASALSLAALLPDVAASVQLLESATGIAKHGADDHLDAGHGFADLVAMRLDLDQPAPDPTEASPELDETEDEPDAAHSWIPLDLVRLGDTPRVPPEMGELIYKGRRHIVSGESESGKSWLCFGIAADELKAGHGVVWVDLDYMGAQDILERLRQLGVPDQRIREGFAFYQPEGPLVGDALADVLALVSSRNARLVVIDAFTGFCALHGLKSKEGDEVEKAYRLMQPLCDTGAAVVIIDHVVKDKANRGAYSAGSERKHSGADIHLGFTLIDVYGRGKTGRAKITVHKDRPAQLTRPTAGIFKLASHPDTHMVKWSLEEDHSTGEDGTWSPTGLMETISRYLEAQASPSTLTDIKACVRGKDEYKVKACERLVQEGYARESKGAKNARLFESSQAYREGDE